MSHPDTTSKDAVFQWRGIPQPDSFSVGTPARGRRRSQRHYPPILVADTCGLSSADKTLIRSL